MTEKTKITLSDAELAIVQETDWILTKQNIIKAVFTLFHEQIPAIKNIVLDNPELKLPEILSAVPKINKGENYHNFPYVIMDYPAVFSKENIFALRTMFWWGNFFSVTIHLSGKYQLIYGPAILQNLKQRRCDFFVCINDNAWQHHFAIENFSSVKDITEEELEIIINKPFFKIALKYSLQQWNSMSQLLGNAYEQILKLVGD
ncbi:MAG: hypothetical protein ABIP30_09905 [Ferruginibacter sp.]